ncbi:MAG TPA: hypothetical protein VFU53_07560 [Burkholderiales bacterium]|nr:hypothetical protein [Burkholderiales bacterium]
MSAKGTLVAFVSAALLAAASAHAAGPSAEQARTEVLRAQQAVQAAGDRRALWTTAQEALAEAQAALERGDYAAAVRASRVAVEQAQLGIEQLDYPRFP